MQVLHARSLAINCPVLNLGVRSRKLKSYDQGLHILHIHWKEPDFDVHSNKFLSKRAVAS